MGSGPKHTAQATQDWDILPWSHPTEQFSNTTVYAKPNAERLTNKQQLL